MLSWSVLKLLEAKLCRSSSLFSFLNFSVVKAIIKVWLYIYTYLYLIHYLQILQTSLSHMDIYNNFLCNLIHIWRRNRISSFHCLKDKLLSMKTQNNPKTLQPDTPDILLSHDCVARTTVRVHFVGCEVTCTIIFHVSRVSHWLGLLHTSLLRHLRRVSAGECYREDIKPDVTCLVMDMDYSDSSGWWD